MIHSRYLLELVRKYNVISIMYCIHIDIIPWCMAVIFNDVNPSCLRMVAQHKKTVVVQISLAFSVHRENSYDSDNYNIIHWKTVQPITVVLMMRKLHATTHQEEYIIIFCQFCDTICHCHQESVLAKIHVRKYCSRQNYTY